MTDELIPEDPEAIDAEEEEGEDGLLGPDEWPTTVEAAVADVLAGMSEEDQAALRAMARDDLIDLHFGLAGWIRNAYGLWRGNEELLEAAGGSYREPDHVSMVIVERVWETLQGQP